jgi:hypothetical protein
MGSGSGWVGLALRAEEAPRSSSPTRLDRAETVRLVEWRAAPPSLTGAMRSKETDVESTMLAVSTFGRLDIVFNNVGVPTPGRA